MVQNEKTVQELVNENRHSGTAVAVPLSQIPPVTTEHDDYVTTRAISSFIAFLGWLTVIAGGIAIFTAFSNFRYGGILALLPSLGIMVAGLFLVTSGQITRAIVDNTNYNKQMVGLLKRAFPQSEDADPKVLMQKAQETYENGFCPECGAEIEAEAVRCEKCGTNLLDIAISSFKAKEANK